MDKEKKDEKRMMVTVARRPKGNWKETKRSKEKKPFLLVWPLEWQECFCDKIW